MATLVPVEWIANVGHLANALTVEPLNPVHVAIPVAVEQTANVGHLASARAVQRQQSVRVEMRINVEQSASVGQVVSVQAVGHLRVASVYRASAEHSEHFELLKAK